MVTSTVHAIKQLKTVDGVNMKGLQELIPWADFKFRYISKSKSQHIKVMSTSKYLLKIPIWIDWLVILKLDLRINLSWLLLISTILPNCHTFLIIHACTEDLEAFAEYGNDHVETLAHQFNGIVAASLECLEEWSSFRRFMKDNCKHLKQREVISNLCCHSSWTTIYPNMSVLAKICRVVPIHIADVERTFSQLKLIKTRVGNRMNEKTLDSLLRIAIEDPSIGEFPLTEAVKLWATKKNGGLSH